MGRRRVVITGLGTITALGNNSAEFWDRLSHGCPAIGPITQIDVSEMRIKNGAEARRYDPAAHFDAKALDFLDRFAQFAVVAAREAIRDSGLELTPEVRQRAAIVTGSCVGGQNTEDEGFANLYLRNKPRVNPLTIARMMANAGASHIAMDTGITGPAWTVSTACSSSNHALGQAYWLVRDGIAELALAGGSEAPFSFGNLKAWEAMRVVAPDTCRPFARDRKGMVLGEGGALMVVEPLDAALARGARIYAEIAGFGMSADAHHLTQPSVEGPARAMTMALADGAIAIEEVGYINAHGTATPANDPTECAAIRKVFGSRAEKLAISSTKSMHGHALGAAGAIEAAATVLALHHGILPPTANFTEIDPECDLDVIPNEPRRAEVAAALSNSFAFGGLNAVVGFRKLR